MKHTPLSKTKEFILILLISALYIGGVFVVLRIPGCGYHLVDDHEFTAWTYLLTQRHIPLTDLIREYLGGNLAAGRWRPLYLIMRGLFISVFGTDIRLYYIWAITKTVILFILIYYMARSMGAGIINSYLSSFIALTGYQSATWWKLGTHEVVTAIWFVLGMILMIRYQKTDRRILAVSSLISFLIMCLYKETFIVLLPFAGLYMICEDMREHTDKTQYSQGTISDTLKDAVSCFKLRCVYYIVLILIFAISIIIILTCTGNDYMNYSERLTSTTGVGITPLIESFGTDMKWFISFGMMLLVILISHDIEFTKLTPDLILFAAFILPQFALFSTSGMTERYIIPFSIGFGLFFCCQAPQHMKMGQTRRYMYYGLMIVMLIAHVRAMLIEGNYFRYRGESVTAMLDTIDRYTAEHPEKEPHILSCLYFEGSNLIYTHELLEGHDCTYELNVNWIDDEYTIHPIQYTHYVGFQSSQPELRSYDNTDDIDILVAYNHEDRHWEYDILEIPGYDLSGFTKTTCGTLDVYTRP